MVGNLLPTFGDWIALAFWLLFFGALAAGLRHTYVERRRAARNLERGRKTYPCSHGAAGTTRWPEQGR